MKLCVFHHCAYWIVFGIRSWMCQCPTSRRMVCFSFLMSAFTIEQHSRGKCFTWGNAGGAGRALLHTCTTRLHPDTRYRWCSQWVAPSSRLAALTKKSRIGLTATGVRYSLRTGRQRQVVQFAADGYAQCKLCKKPRRLHSEVLGSVFTCPSLCSDRCSGPDSAVLCLALQVHFLDNVVVPVLCNDRFFDTTVSTDFFRFVVGRDKEFMQRALSLLRGAMRIVPQIMGIS